ncbi:MAG: hypothetical protein M1817_001956 [Caeruleum heppii]|nr:MAG: hypothetical protein M1817_001956 [Caeruleum heppii]
MGIKGIYQEIGPGNKVALARLVSESIERTGRPLRVAIDISIWLFQVQSGKGGTNPALRTLYYRLLRLLALSIQPLFVFDGPRKPQLKRDRIVSHNSAPTNSLAKKLLGLFAFPYHDAAGEAEAECALLQQKGIVDAVLSEDVDTLMFGCGLSLRNWSSDGQRGSKTPTHVDVYSAEETRNGESGLDREGMILVAMMSGGDYNTAGIPRCGIKIACEAARAGFGSSLCKIARSDRAGFKEWKEGLAYQLETNENKYFRTRHKTLRIPENFPDRDTLDLYRSPAVSSAAKLELLESNLRWDGELDVSGLRAYVAEIFDWTCKSGAKKFIRTLAPALLSHILRVRGQIRDEDPGAAKAFSGPEPKVIEKVHDKRVHFSTDGLEELRVEFSPLEIVRLDLEAEESDAEDPEEGEADGLDDEAAVAALGSEDEATSTRPDDGLPPRRQSSQYDPSRAQRVWLLGSFVRKGVPAKVRGWEELQRSPKKPVRTKAPSKRGRQIKDAQRGTLDRFVKVTKPGSSAGQKIASQVVVDRSDQRHVLEPSPPLPVFKNPSFELHEEPSLWSGTVAPSSSLQGEADSLHHTHRPEQMPTTLPTDCAAQRSDPWSLGERPEDSFNISLPQGKRFSALGIYPSGDNDDGPTMRSEARRGGGSAAEVIFSETENPSTPSKSSRSRPREPYQTPRTVRQTKAKSTPTASPSTLKAWLQTEKDTSEPHIMSEERPPPDFLTTPSTIRHWKSGRTLTSVLTSDDPQEGDARSYQTLLSATASARSSPSIANHPIPSSPPLPPASSLLTSPSANQPHPQIHDQIIEISSSPLPTTNSRLPHLTPTPPTVPQPTSPNQKATHRTIILRESLEGSWKDIDPAEIIGPPQRVFEGVEVVDLSGA